MSLLRDLRSLGFSVFPCYGKSPAVRWKPFQSRKPTLQEISLWDHFFPDANAAIVTGAISDIVVLDIDGLLGLESLALLPPLPRTVRVLTGSGLHFYFRHPGGRVANQVSILPGIDVRGDGGYVIAPGSLHPSGKRYRWTDPYSPADLQPIDPEVHGSLLQPATVPPTGGVAPPEEGQPLGSEEGVDTKWGKAALWGEISRLMRVPSSEGNGRNAKLNASAFRLGQVIAAGHLTEYSATRGLLAIWIERWGKNEHEGIRTIRSGIRAGRQQPRRPQPLRDHL